MAIKSSPTGDKMRHKMYKFMVIEKGEVLGLSMQEIYDADFIVEPHDDNGTLFVVKSRHPDVFRAGMVIENRKMEM